MDLNVIQYPLAILKYIIEILQEIKNIQIICFFAKYIHILGILFILIKEFL
jgi:hypothetical protein